MTRDRVETALVVTPLRYRVGASEPKRNPFGNATRCDLPACVEDFSRSTFLGGHGGLIERGRST